MIFNILLLILLSILLMYIFIFLLKNKSIDNFRYCSNNEVQYNDYCDIHDCDYICDKTTQYCSENNRCTWILPQKAGKSCIFNEECISKNCFYGYTGLTKNIGVCI